jgi:hypothetical protein
MQPYRLGDLRQRANLLHHQILQNEVALQQVNDRLQDVARLQAVKRALELELAKERPQLADLEKGIRDLEARERAELAPQRAKLVEALKPYTGGRVATPARPYTISPSMLPTRLPLYRLRGRRR